MGVNLGAERDVCLHIISSFFLVVDGTMRHDILTELAKVTLHVYGTLNAPEIIISSRCLKGLVHHYLLIVSIYSNNRS